MKKFTWTPNSENTYTADYGSQFIIDAAENLSLNKVNYFTMDAQGERLTLIPDNIPNNTADITFDAVLYVYNGQLVLDFSRVNKSFKTAQIIVESTSDGGSAVLEVREAKYIEPTLDGPPRLRIEKNGVCNFLSFSEETNNPVIGHFTYNVVLKANGRLFIFHPTQSNNTLFINKSSFELSNSSSMELQVSNLSTYTDTNVNLQDSTKCWLSVDNLNVGGVNLAFNLSTGNPEVLISGFRSKFTTIDTTVKFNFSSGSKGQAILDFAYADQSGANIFGQKWLLDNGMLLIDGVPQKDASKLNFDYANQYMVISLK